MCYKEIQKLECDKKTINLKNYDDIWVSGFLIGEEAENESFYHHLLDELKTHRPLNLKKESKIESRFFDAVMAMFNIKCEYEFLIYPSVVSVIKVLAMIKRGKCNLGVKNSSKKQEERMLAEISEPLREEMREELSQLFSLKGKYRKAKAKKVLMQPALPF